MKKIITPLAFLLLFTSSINGEKGQPAEVGQGPFPAIDFEQETFNFGTIVQGEKVVVQIFDSTGQLVKDLTRDRVDDRVITVDITSLHSGIYTASLSIGNRMRLAKQIVVL